MIHSYAEFMFQTGLLDEIQRDYFKNATDVVGALIAQKKWIEADKVHSKFYTLNLLICILYYLTLKLKIYLNFE